MIVEAVQWFKFGDEPSVLKFNSPVMIESECKHCSGVLPTEHGWIQTLEGGHIVCPGDWVITGVRGEKYPCKPDIFEATYDPV